MSDDRSTPATSGHVIVRCAVCGATKVVRPGEIARGDVPMCDACFSPMVAVEAHHG